MQDIDQLFSDISKLSVLVVGDVMLDKYCYGNVERISPEAPVPIIHIHNKENRLGGAANVALNAVRLGAKVTIASVCGHDENGKLLLEILEKNEINPSLIINDKERSTTTKTRIIAKNQQILRMDEEEINELSTLSEHSFIEKVLKFIQIEKPDVVILEDYDKGVMKENVILKIMNHCKNVGCITAVDPKYNNFFSYKDATIFKPNLSELKNALGINRINNLEEDIFTLADQLNEKIKAQVLMITLSEYGMFFAENGESGIIPAKKRNIADVSGAGDTSIAVAALIYAVTRDVYYSVKSANIAGGIVCEHVGVVPIDKEKLKEEMKKSVME